MALIEWKDEFNIGIGPVDHEHRQLIGLINGIADDLDGGASVDDILGALGDIFARISAHFALEENAMRAMAYGQYDAHKADHERLLDDIRDIMDEVRDDPASSYRRRLAGRLEKWFSRHFQSFDARLHKNN